MLDNHGERRDAIISTGKHHQHHPLAIVGRHVGMDRLFCIIRLTMDIVHLDGEQMLNQYEENIGVNSPSNDVGHDTACNT